MLFRRLFFASSPKLYFMKTLTFKREWLKVPQRENFLLAFFAQTKPIWVCDLEIKKKKCLRLTPDFDSFCFFAEY